MNRKALGRGLGALLSSSQILDPRVESNEIPMELVEVGSSQPRTYFDDESLTRLADSIRTHGVVQPILVRRQGVRYELVAGERRFRAARMAGLENIPAVVKEIPDEQLLEIALIENIQREDLNPIEEAQAYKKLIEGVGLTQEALAVRVGRDRSYITNYIRLLRLSDDLQQLVKEKRLSTGHARSLLGLPEVDQQRRAARQIIEQDLSVRATERLVKVWLEAPRVRERPRTPVGDANTLAAENKLRRTLGTQVKILQSSPNGKGKIEISFSDNGELDRIYSILARRSSEL